MDRINTPTKQANLFGAGKHGFRDGDTNAGISPTDLDAVWFNDFQEEMMTIIEGAGLVPTAGVRTQVYQAIQLLIATATSGMKVPVRYTTTANIVLSGLGTQAGGDWPGAMTAGDRVLVKDQATGADRGIYLAAAGPWVRANDADGANELLPGAVVSVQEGTAFGDSQWMLTTNGPIVIGTTALTFTRQGAGTSSGLQPLTATAAAGVMTITLGPTSLDFRDVTATTGGGINVANGAPITLVVPATTNFGLATANGTQRLPVLAMNNGLSMELALGTLMGGVNFDETTLLTTVAIGAATTLASVGSTTARANLAHKVVGFVDALFTTGTGWTISRVQPAGGQALGALSSYGYGQSWKTAAFSPGTTYYNGPKPIEVAVNSNLTATGGAVTFSITGPSGPVSVVAGMLINTAGGSYNGGATCTIPANCAWSFSLPGSFVGSQVMN